MQKKRIFSLLAGIVASAVLMNSVAVGAVTTSISQTVPSAQDNTLNEIIDNSDLVPDYVPDEDVNLIQIDGASTAQTPEWIQSLILTEVTVKTASTNGQFSGMVKTLDHLKKTGVNGIWLSPINDNGSNDENNYLNYGPHTVAEILTGQENYEDGWQEVKSFVDAAHARNIRVFLDIVTWGTHKDSPLYTQHSDWYSGEELYGGYAFNWNNSELYNWFKNQMTAIIKTTGADGFRADCGSMFCGTQLFKDVRAELISDGRKIAIFSECAEVRDGTFDFEEHTVTNTHDSTFWNTAEFYIENNIVDAVKNGTTLGTSDLLAINEGGKGRFYSSLISCHDFKQYGSDNLVPIGYGAILAPFIPMWYIGEEWNNSVNIPSNQQLYRNGINWYLIDENRGYYESIKKFIRIRRTYGNIFETSAENHRNSNICAVTTDGSLQAYARYADGKAVIVVPNNGTATQEFNITIPYSAASLTSGDYCVFDLMNHATVLSGNSNDLTSFTVTVAAGEVGVYLIEQYTDITDCAFYENNDHTLEIRLDADQNIQLGDGSYWWRNLQQMASGATKEHNAFAKLLRKSIFINGMSVDEALLSSIDQSASTRIWTTANNKLIITIKSDDNPYGISTSSDFTLEIKDGLTFNGYALLPKKLNYVALRKQFVDLGKTADIISAECANGTIVLKTNSIIKSSEDVLAAIGNNILINGTAVTSGVTTTNNEIRIAYEANADFDLQIKSGITLNGKEIMPARYSFKYTAAVTDYQVGEYLIPEVDEDGANITGAAILSVESGYCSSGHDAANWVIRFSLDKNIYSNCPNAYYDRHLQVNTTYGAGIRSNVMINGRNLDECIGNGDQHSAIHVKANEDIFEIAVPKNNNFGFDGDQDFEIALNDQISMPDCVINPAIVKYKAANASFAVTENSEPVFTTKNVSDTGVSAGYVEVQSQASGYCTSHGGSYNPEQWLINIAYLGSIDPGYSSYYNRHLQAYEDIKDVIGSNIKLNGKTLTEYVGSGDLYTAVHVAVTGNNSNVLQIAVPKDNSYGFNGDDDFTVEVLDGITLGSATLNPVYVKHMAAFVTASVTENAPNRVKPDTSVNADVYLYFDKTFDISVNGNTAQDITTQSTAANRKIALDLCKYIKINGETVQEVLSRGNSLYAVQFSIGNSGNQGYIRIRFDLPDDMAALMSGELFTIEFMEGFALDGYSIQHKVCTTDNLISSDPTVSGGYWVKAGSAMNGTVTPRRSQDDWTMFNQVLQANDFFRVQVTPDDGYQMKAGSLIYSYMHKGEKKSIPLLESADGANFNYTIADVVGQVDAQFVGKYDGINFATVGANSAKSQNKGIRFVTRLYLDNIDFETEKVTIGETEYDIVNYGTLIGFEGTELTLDTAVKAQCEPKVYRNVNGVFVDFTAELVNISDSNADTNFVARGYFSYKDAEGNVTTVYSDSAVRSANSVIN